MATFHYFQRLPAELRLAIWRYGLPSLDQEVYFANREDFEIADPDDFHRHVTAELDGTADEWVDETLIEPKVTLAIPAMMHVNREARALASEHLTFQDDYLRDGSVVKIPCRDLDLARDAFFVNAIDLPWLIEAIAHAQDDWYKEIRHLALHAFCLAHGFGDFLRLIASTFHGLRRISIVFGPSWRDGSENDYGEDEDADPFSPLRQFRLEPWTEETGCIIHGDLSTEQEIEDIFDGFHDSLAFAEVTNESPYDPAADDGEGAWLFEFDAQKLKKIAMYEL